MTTKVWVVLAVLAMTMGAATTVPAMNDWPQFMYDVTHQGAVPPGENSEFAPFLQKWWNNVSISQPITVRGSPVEYGGMVYVAASDGFPTPLTRRTGAWSGATTPGAPPRARPWWPAVTCTW